MSTLLITGTGSLATRIMHRFKDKYDRIIAVSRGESTHLDLPPWIISELGDIRDFDRLSYLFNTYRPDVCIHTAAFKVLPLMQRYVMECVNTNVTGTSNIARVCHLYDTKQSLLIGTDKAVNPIHNQIYGLSKAVARAAYVDYSARPSNTSFLICNYANVAKSKNSFIPIWENQIKNDKPIDITHEDITRFIFTLDDAVDLISDTLGWNINGGTVIPIMDSFRIVDVALAIGVMLNKPVKMNMLNKLRPGEKMHEDMTSIHEQHLTYWLSNKRLCVIPSFETLTDYSQLQDKPYTGLPLSSDKYINTNIDSIVELLKRSRID